MVSMFSSQFVRQFVSYCKAGIPSFIMALQSFWSSPVQAEYALNMPRGVTEISHEIYRLHMMIFWVCVAVGILVFFTMFYAILKHRKSLGVTAAHFHENTVVEIIWTIIPFIILVVMAVPATKLLIKMGDTKTDSVLTIKITGHQWRWEYEYLEEGVRFISNLKTPQIQIKNRDIKSPHYLLEVDNPLVVPAGKKIRFLMTAADVIHSWWVPELGIKRDAIPGFINEAWTNIEHPGTYRGQCAELCGVNHGFMPIVIIAKTEEEYTAWLMAEKAAATKTSSESTSQSTPSQTTTAPETTAKPAQEQSHE